MDKLTSSKLELAIQTPDAIQAWNIVVKARGLYFVLDYTTHHPILFVGTKDKDPEAWQVVDTRKRTVVRLPLDNENAVLGLNDLEDRLHKLGLRLSPYFDVNKQRQKFVSLRLVPIHGGRMTTVLDRIPRGSKKVYAQFALNDRW